MPQLEVTINKDFCDYIMLLSSTGLIWTLAWIAYGQNSEGWNYLSMSTLRRLYRRSFGIDK